MKRKLVLVAVAFVASLAAGCGGSTFGAQKCVILTNGGNKLCGDDARAWCDSSDAIRSTGLDMATDAEFGDATSAASIRESQAVCDQIRGT